MKYNLYDDILVHASKYLRGLYGVNCNNVVIAQIDNAIYNFEIILVKRSRTYANFRYNNKYFRFNNKDFTRRDIIHSMYDIADASFLRLSLSLS